MNQEEIQSVLENFKSQDMIASYLTGIIEGEGWIDKKAYRITIANSSLNLLNLVNLLIEKLIGYQGSITNGQKASAHRLNKSDCKALTISGKIRLSALIPKIAPFLVNKKIQAEAALEILATRKTYNLKSLQKRR